MRKFLINIFLFFAIIAVVDFCVGFTGDYLQAHAKGGETRKTNDLVMNERHDILVLGSSRACHHYDTPYLSKALGLDVYNAGYDGNGVVLSYGLLSMIFERYQPKLILFDVEPAFDINEYAADNGHKRYIAPLKPYYEYECVEKVIRDVNEEEWYKVHSGMMRYNTTIISKAMDFITNERDMEKGFVPMHGVYAGNQRKRLNSATVKQDDFKLRYVEGLILLAKSYKVPIIVVASPKYWSVSSAELQPVIDICKKYDVPFIDYYADEGFMQHKEWFKEPMHLNAAGARVFSEKMIGTISSFIW